MVSSKIGAIEVPIETDWGVLTKLQKLIRNPIFHLLLIAGVGTFEWKQCQDNKAIVSIFLEPDQDPDPDPEPYPEPTPDPSPDPTPEPTPEPEPEPEPNPYPLPTIPPPIPLINNKILSFEKGKLKIKDRKWKIKPTYNAIPLTH